MKHLLTFLILLLAATAYAQPSIGSLSSYMEAVRTGSYDPVPEVVLEDVDNHDRILEVLAEYETDSIVRVRSRAYNIAKRIGQGSTDPTVRQEAVSQLVRGIADGDGGVSGNCSSGLTGFRPADFTEANRQLLPGYVKPNQSHLDQLVMLVGYLQPDGGMDRLNRLLTEEGVNTKTKWSTRLALARMGDEAAVSYLTAKLQTAAVNDNFVYDIVPDLIYTRRPEVFDFLEQIIMSEEPTCSSADPDRSDKILCAYRVLEYIAYAIEDFPIPVDQYNEAEITDYEQALADVRDWFAGNQTYALRRDLY